MQNSTKHRKKQSGRRGGGQTGRQGESFLVEGKKKTSAKLGEKKNYRAQDLGGRGQTLSLDWGVRRGRTGKAEQDFNHSRNCEKRKASKVHKKGDNGDRAGKITLHKKQNCDRSTCKSRGKVGEQIKKIKAFALENTRI